MRAALDESPVTLADNRSGTVDDLLERLQTCRDVDQRRSIESDLMLLTLAIADSAARRYVGRGVDVDDLTQVARLALVKAIRRYRCGRGPGFAAYAVPTITGEIKRYFRDCGWAVRPPRRLQEVRARLLEAEPELRQKLQREPDDDELASAIGVTRGELDEARAATCGYRTASLDAEPDGTPIQVSDGRADIDWFLTSRALRQTLARLTAREREILRLRFVEERTQAEIGQVIGVSQMQVSRLLSGLLGRLRHELGPDCSTSTSGTASLAKVS
jgi:RNA polymerase sigma-B factor